MLTSHPSLMSIDCSTVYMEGAKTLPASCLRSNGDSASCPIPLRRSSPFRHQLVDLHQPLVAPPGMGHKTKVKYDSYVSLFAPYPLLSPCTYPLIQYWKGRRTLEVLPIQLLTMCPNLLFLRSRVSSHSRTRCVKPSGS